MKLRALAMALLVAPPSPLLAQVEGPAARNILLWPMPETVSPEGRAAAEASAKAGLPDPLPPLDAIRSIVSAMQSAMGAKLHRKYNVRVAERVIAGVPVRVIYPEGMTDLGTGPVLMNLHGGGGKLDSGSLTETIPIAGLTKMPVVAVLYRLAPENPYPARLDDALAVYLALAQDRNSAEIGVYGTSAGAILGAQLVALLTKLGKPMPGALGFFSGTADAARKGDSESWIPEPSGPLALETDFGVPSDDPVLSPIYGDLSRFPPTLLMTSTRDLALSGTVNFGRELLVHGVDARLVAFDGLPHAFWTYMPDIPETEQANAIISNFLAEHLREDSRQGSSASGPQGPKADRP